MRLTEILAASEPGQDRARPKARADLERWKDRGYCVLWRGFFDDPLFKRRERATRLEAFIRLWAAARGTPAAEKIGKRFINLDRGQLIISQRKLAAAWGWQRRSVQIFLIKLERRGAITLKSIPGAGGYSVLTWTRYSELNPLEGNGRR